MASSESSLRSSLGDEDAPAIVADDPFAEVEEEQEIRHLFPCSWQEFLELEPPGIGFYEYVDGFVIWRSNMADTPHTSLVTSHMFLLGLCKQTKCCAYPSVELVNDQNQFQKTVKHEQDSSGHGAESPSEDRNGGSSSRDRNGGSSSKDHNGGSSSRDRKGGSSSRDHNGGSSSRDHSGGSSSRDRNGGSSSKDHNGGSSSRDRHSGSSSRDHNGGSSSRDHSGGSSSRDRNGGSSSKDHNGGSSSRDRNGGSSSREHNGGSSSSHRNGESSSGDANRASSSRDPVRIQSDMRHPDFSVEHCSENDSNNSMTVRDPVKEHRIFYSRPITSHLRVLVEVTSHSTRRTDLVAKWRAYARTNVKMYVILDRGTPKGQNKRVIVGTLEQLQPNDRRSTSGDKEEPPSPPPSPPNARATSSQGTARDEPPVFYYRRVYTGNETVDCPYYCELGLTVNQLLDAKYMDQLANRKRVENEQKHRRLEETSRAFGVASKERDVYKKEIEEGKRREEALRRNNAEGKRREEALRRNNAEGKGREEALRRNNAEGKRREEALRRNNAEGKRREEALRRRLEKYEQDAANNKKGQSSGSSSPEHKKSRKK